MQLEFLVSISRILLLKLCGHALILSCHFPCNSTALPFSGIHPLAWDYRSNSRSVQLPYSFSLINTVINMAGCYLWTVWWISWSYMYHQMCSEPMQSQDQQFLLTSLISVKSYITFQIFEEVWNVTFHATVQFCHFSVHLLTRGHQELLTVVFLRNDLVNKLN